MSIDPREKHKTHGVPRSKQWGQFKREYTKTHPKMCAVCDTKLKVQLHHLRPFHLHPELELDTDNMIWLCERPGHDHHFMIGHLEDFKSFNPQVEIDAPIWHDKIKNRSY